LTSGHPALADDHSAPPYDPAKLRHLRAEDLLPVYDIAFYWAPQISSDPHYARTLAMNFSNFLLRGEADGISGAVQVWVSSKGVAYPRAGREWARKVRQAASEFNKPALDVLWDAIEGRWLMVRREAVWVFCDRTGLRVPSFWPRRSRLTGILHRIWTYALRRGGQLEQPQEPSDSSASDVGCPGQPAVMLSPSVETPIAGQQADIVTQLVEFFNAGEKLTNKEAYDAACAQFGDCFIDRDFDDARSRTDPAKKYRRGERKRSSQT
jgi:hypothetical protein